MLGNTYEQQSSNYKSILLLINLFLALCFLFSGCSSIVQKSGEIVDGSFFDEMELAAYRSKAQQDKTRIELRELKLDDGKWITEIESSRWPGLSFRGSMPAGNGSIELFQARIFSSHVNGWNSFTLDTLGSAFFNTPLKAGSDFRITSEVERIQISSGSIRLKSSRFTGNAALTALRNRRERILALIEWMEKSSGQKRIFSSENNFEAYWKKRLFPELMKARERTPEYTTRNAKWRRADSVRWNLTYTEKYFTEDLWEYRNSGAMLRDWEEALAWIFIEYSWDYIVESFSNIYLSRIK